ncbi:MAG TPA: hypothetical protein VF541_23435 [Longimicrobium sp.]|jgi:hypothetical protein
MEPAFLRDVEFYVDIAGRSEVMKQLATIAKSDTRGSFAIQSAMKILRQLGWQELLAAGYVKKPTPTIYVLIVQSGPVAYRLPLFEPLCRGGALVVITHCEKRATLRRDAYQRLIDAAEKRRQDWLRRYCPEG